MAVGPLVVDACSSLNLFATGREVELVRATGRHLIVLPEVANEVQYLLGELDDEGERAHVPVDWAPLLDSGLATQRVLPNDALRGFVEFAEHLTDNDARCAAMAQHLGCGLLSDDGKVRKTFSSKCPTLDLLSIVSVVRLASERLGFERPAIAEIFQRIRERARFEPSRRDPAFDWFSEQTT